jgi:hypothetical protein
MEEGQTMQWTKGQTIIYKNYTETEDWETRTLLKTSGELSCPGSEILNMHISKFTKKCQWHAFAKILKYII